MPLDPTTLQNLAQNNLGKPPGVQQQQNTGYQQYQVPETQQLPDATAPITQRRQELKGLMDDPLSNPQYKAYADTVNQQGAATTQRAVEGLKGAADPLAVQRELEKYDFQTRALLANRLGDLYSQQQGELGQLAGTEAGLIDSAAGRTQQGNQFNAQLGEQSSQYGYGQNQQQGQFTAGQNQQQRQFDTSTTQQQRQFDQTLSNRQQEFAQQQQLSNRQLDLQEEKQSVFHTVADSFFGGAGKAAGTALGGWVGGILGGLETGGGYTIPGTWQGVPYAQPQNRMTATPSWADSMAQGVRGFFG